MTVDQISTRVPIVWLEAGDATGPTTDAFVRAFSSFGMEAAVIDEPAALATVPPEVDVVLWVGRQAPGFCALHIAIGVEARADIMLRGDELDIDRIAAAAVAPLIER